jgi:hypothetical protein
VAENRSKTVAFIAVMAALGNALSFLSIQLSPIAPSIPLGPVTVSLAIDLSHMATFVAAIFGGPVVGLTTGAVSGMVAAFQFGFSQGNFITGFGLPVGKALTGLAAGLLASRLQIDKNPRLVALTVISYIPEGLFTLLIFMQVLPALMGLPSFVGAAVGYQIVVKAFLEMVLMGVLLIGVTGNKAFHSYAQGFFPKRRDQV